MSPLQLVLFRRANDDDSLAYEEAVVRAFQGGKAPGPYLATGDDLGIQLRVFSEAPPFSVDELHADFAHTVVVVLIDHGLVQADADLWAWLDECAAKTLSSSDNRLLCYALDAASAKAAVGAAPKLGELQIGIVSDLGEPAIRPALFALRVLHECRQVLSESLARVDPQHPSFMKIFISHAKVDGLPLAQALKHQIESLPWLKRFYDAEDIAVGAAWKKELEVGISSSVVVMLRTENYDARPWCRQEVLWADEYSAPAVLVDARTQLSHAPPFLPFDRVPVVRIPDGNLLRILFLALREGLRFLLFRVRVEVMKRSRALPPHAILHVFSFQPSMAALLKVCRAVANLGPTLLLYPDPPLSAGSFEAAASLVSIYAPDASLATPNSLATAGVP
jgi:hypothetical protein